MKFHFGYRPRRRHHHHHCHPRESVDWAALFQRSKLAFALVLGVKLVVGLIGAVSAVVFMIVLCAGIALGGGRPPSSHSSHPISHHH